MTSSERDPHVGTDPPSEADGPARLARAIELFLARGPVSSDDDREAFLREHEDYRDLLEPMFEDVDEQPEPEAPPSWQAEGIEPDHQVGDYRIIRQVGRGGMGTVFEAEQVSLRRRVALKVLQPHLSLSAGSIERFRREATSVAGLRHPGLVPIHEVGEWRGVHYFSMEFVDGRSLKELVHAERLGVRNSCTRAVESAELVARVADALHHAHTHDLIHRDVKPHNIMVGKDGEVRLLDFGLVKNLTDDSHSATGGFFGTPHYTSPEQAAGGVALGPTADVFSLGIVLYELLAKRRPFEGDTSREVLASIESGEYEPLSRAARSVPRDLQTICHKALEHDARLRYPHAGEMAADLRRFLRLEPIAARPPGAVLRAWKWTRRHRVRVALCTLAGLLLVGGPSAYAWHVHSTQEVMLRERHVLRQAELFSFHGTEQVLDLVCQQLDRTPGIHPEDRARVDTIVSHCENFLSLRSQDPERRLRVATALLRISQVYQRMREYRAAIDACERTAQILAESPSLGEGDETIRARLVRRRLCLKQMLDPLVADDEFVQAMARWRSELPTAEGEAALEYAETLSLRARALADHPGRRDEAKELFDEVARLLDDGDCERGRAQLTYLSSRVALAAVHAMQGETADAIEVVEPALAALRGLDPTPRITFEQTLGTVTLGLARRALGQRAEAERLLRQALEGAERTLVQYPGNSDLRRTVLRCRLRLSVWLVAERRFVEATKLAEGARRVPELDGPGTWIDHFLHAQVTAQRAVCVLMTNDADRFERAAPLFEEAARGFERLIEDQPDQAMFRASLGGTLNNLAAIANETGRHDDAEEHARRAIEAQHAMLAAAPQDDRTRRQLGMHHSQLALACGSRGEHEQTLRSVDATVEYAGRHLASLRLAAEAACRCAARLRARPDDASAADHAAKCERASVQVLRHMASINPREARRWLDAPRFAALEARQDFRELQEELR